MENVIPTQQTQLLRIGDVAKQTGMTLRALRYYEELDLIGPENRSKGNFRLYHPSVVQRVEFINSLKKLDFSLEEIREIIGSTHALKNDYEVVERTRQALLVKKRKIQEIMLEMEDMSREVDRSLRILEDCTACKQDKSIQCDPHCENKHVHLH